MIRFTRSLSRAVRGDPSKTRSPARRKAVQRPARAQSGANSRGPDRPVCQSLKDLPKGNYVSLDRLGLPSEFARCMAVLERNEGLVLIVDNDSYAGGRHVKAKEMLEGKYRLSHLRATIDVVRSLHGIHSDVEEVDENDSDVEALAWNIVDSAYEKGASDIHIETRSNYADVLLRINGVRVHDQTLSIDRAFSVIQSLYNFYADAQNKDMMWSADAVKDAVIDRRTRSGANLQIRFHSAPIAPAGNVHVVCRLLSMDSSRALSLDELRYLPAQQAAIERMLLGARGLVLLVGPTNSGKTTTIQALIRRIQEYRGPTIKISTVEDPVEYIIPGACQMGVPRGRKSLEGQDGSIMAELLRATLRQDPDVVMLGEIRDEESAKTAQNLSLSGRKILATLHAFEGMAAFYRLREIGIPESVLFMPGFLSGIIFQRLVPTVCPHCAVPFAEGRDMLDEALIARLESCLDLQNANVRLRSPDGCDNCRRTGIGGRTLCAEVIEPDEHMLSLLVAGRFQEARAYWLAQPALHVPGVGLPTALAHGVYLIAAGQVDPRDVEAQVDLLSLGTQDSNRSGVLRRVGS